MGLIKIVGTFSTRVYNLKYSVRGTRPRRGIEPADCDPAVRCGRHALPARCRAMGRPLSSEELGHAYTQMTTVADRKKTVDDKDLEGIIRAARSKCAAGAAAGFA